MPKHHPTPPFHRILDNQTLVPKQWREAAARGPVWCFNPSLLALENGWALAYRVVLQDGLRRIALCRVDSSLEVVTDSAVPLSDQLGFRPDTAYPERVRSWFADPRLFRVGGKVYVYWNSGWHEPANHQFVQELREGRSEERGARSEKESREDAGARRDLRPIGCAHELLLEGKRRAQEKNWCFPEGLPGLCVYSASPHTLLAFDPSVPGDWVMSPLSSQDWDSGAAAGAAGGLRGGAAPARDGDRFLSVCHAVTDSPSGYKYQPFAYTFSAKAPHAPLTRPRSPLPLPNPAGPRNLLPRLNPVVGEVVYPSGLAAAGDAWLVSYGINDEACALALLTKEQVEATQERV